MTKKTALIKLWKMYNGFPKEDWELIKDAFDWYQGEIDDNNWVDDTSDIIQLYIKLKNKKQI